MKKIILGLMLLCITVIITGCELTSDEKQSAQQEKILLQGTAQIGIPAIKNFQERKLMKMILELRDQEKLITYVYLFNEMQGKLVFIGKAIGFGLPYSTQFTNPQKIEYPSGVVIAQADPNGLFSPSSAAGTWIMMLDKDGKPHPVYIEPNIIVSVFPLM